MAAVAGRKEGNGGGCCGLQYIGAFRKHAVLTVTWAYILLYKLSKVRKYAQEDLYWGLLA
jgi:hypothetical protein